MQGASPTDVGALAAPVVLKNGVLNIQMYYEDTDFSGIVYHGNYLKYFERARDELMGLELVRKAYEEGLAASVAKVSDLTFRGFCKHSDVLIIETNLVSCGKLRMAFEQTARVLSNGQPGDVIVSARTEVGWVDVETQKGRPVPEYLRISR